MNDEVFDDFDDCCFVLRAKTDQGQRITYTNRASEHSSFRQLSAYFEA
jgi:hypothetical protein